MIFYYHAVHTTEQYTNLFLKPSYHDMSFQEMIQLIKI